VDPPLAAEETEGFESPGLQVGTIDKKQVTVRDLNLPFLPPLIAWKFIPLFVPRREPLAVVPKRSFL
jgi:hypothetical protein